MVKAYLKYDINKICNNLVLMSVLISLFGNMALSILMPPRLFILCIFLFRDIILVFVVILLLLYSKYNKINQYIVIWLTSAIVFVFLLYFVYDIPIKAVLEKTRNHVAIPIMLLFFSNRFNLAYNVIERAIKIFVLLTVIELIVKALGLGSEFHRIINLTEYFHTKGTSVGYGFGLLGSSRTLTPMLQPSLGGVILSLISICFLRKRSYFWFSLALLGLIFTISKTGVLLLISYFAICISPILTFIGVLVSPLLLETILNASGVMHLSSILYHFEGYYDGYRYLFQPVGVGRSGTVLATDGREVGAESGLGAFLSAFGIFGAMLLLIFFIRSNNKVLMLFAISITLTEITLNLYVAAIFSVLVYAGSNNEASS